MYDRVAGPVDLVGKVGLSGQDGSPGLSCAALASATPCRFIPALSWCPRNSITALNLSALNCSNGAISPYPALFTTTSKRLPFFFALIV